MSNSPVEPRHDLRQAAMALFEMYIAFKDSGFSEAQSLQLVAHMATQNNDGGSE